MTLHKIKYNLDRESIRSGKPKVMKKISEVMVQPESDQHYLELIKLLDGMLSDSI